MADKFVKVGGDDSKDGSTWALAKATIQAGLTACNSSAGTVDRCIVAPGYYNEQLATTGGLGDAANRKLLIGDTTEAITDSESATHGFGAGRVVIAKFHADHYLTARTFNITTNTTWRYWTLKNLTIAAYTEAFFTNDGANMLDLKFDDCEMVSIGSSTLEVSSKYSTTHFEFNRCIILNTCGFIAKFSIASGGTMPASPHAVFNDCYLYSVGTTGSVQSYGNSSSNTFYTQFNRCTVISGVYLVGGYTADYNKAEFIDCRIGAQVLSYTGSGMGMTLAYTSSDIMPWQQALSGTGLTNLAVSTKEWHFSVTPPWWLFDSYGTADGPSSGTDLHGNTRTAEQGAQEVVSNKWPRHPVTDGGVDFVPAYDTVAGGGGGRTPKLNVVR